MSGEKGPVRFLFKSLQELSGWFYGIDHEDLYNINLPKNPVVQKNPIPGLDPNDFVPVKINGDPVVVKNVKATMYADERDGTMWDGYPTKIETIFDTREPTAALNSSLYGRFPVGSVVKVSFTSKTDGITRSTLVRITDNKGGEGIDLSFAAANDIKFTGGGSVTLQLYVEKGCEFNRSNPFKCGDKQISIIWKTSDWTVNGRKYDRDSKKVEDFRFHKYALTYLFDKLGVLDDIQMFIRLSRIDSEHDPYSNLNIMSGYFTDLYSAGMYIYDICYLEIMGQSPLNKEEGDIIASACNEAVVDVRPFSKKGAGIIYAKNGVKYSAMEVAEMWAGQVEMGEEYFDFLDIKFKSKLDADMFTGKFGDKGVLRFIKKADDGTYSYRFIKSKELSSEDTDILALEIQEYSGLGSEGALDFEYQFGLSEQNLKRSRYSLR